MTRPPHDPAGQDLAGRDASGQEPAGHDVVHHDIAAGRDHGERHPRGRSSAPARFRRWRRSRPFWGGLWAALGGAAILLAPLAPLPLIIRQGVAGVSGYLVGALLVAVGLLSWAQSGQRAFLGVAAMALSLASFVTSNFGGFGVGVTFGVVGGAMLVAWVPGKHGRPGRTGGSADTTSAGARRGPGASGIGHDDSPAGGGRAFEARAVTALPAILALLVHGAPTSAPVEPPQVTGFSTVDGSWLKAARLTMNGVRFHGAVTRRTAAGPARHLKLTMDVGRAIDGEHRFERAGGPALRQRFSALTMSGGVVMYATRLRFRVGGVPLTLTPVVPTPPLPLRSVTVTEVEADGLRIRAARADVAGLTQTVPAVSR